MHQAVACYRSADRDEAERLCKAILDAKADHLGALHLLSLIEHDRGNFCDVIRLTDQALAIEPNFAEGLYNRGCALAALNRQQEALESFRQSLAIRPNFAEALHNCGNALVALNRQQEALATYDRALALNPGFAEARTNRRKVFVSLSRELNRPDTRPLPVYFGHHKCATQFIDGIANDFCTALNMYHAQANGAKYFNFDLSSLVEQLAPDYLAYINAEHRYAITLSNFVAFHVIRDPRDIAISAYFSHRYSHQTKHWPELPEHRAKLERLNFEDGLLLDMDFTDRLETAGYSFSPFKAIEEWDYNQPNVLELKFEELIADIEGVLFKAFAFIGLLPENEEGPRLALREAIAKHQFKKLSKGRAPGEEDVTHHYRHGVAGDWKRYFSTRHKQWFKDRYLQLLIKTGYETDSSW